MRSLLLALCFCLLVSTLEGKKRRRKNRPRQQERDSGYANGPGPQFRPGSGQPPPGFQPPPMPKGFGGKRKMPSFDDFQKQFPNGYPEGFDFKKPPPNFDTNKPPSGFTDWFAQYMNDHKDEFKPNGQVPPPPKEEKRRKRNFYEVLGVSPRANTDEIKKSFRKLAREFHPDKHKDSDKKENEDLFIELANAYEVLSDEKKRRKYDMTGSEEFAQGSSGEGGEDEFDEFGGFSSFEEAWGAFGKFSQQQPADAMPIMEDTWGNWLFVIFILSFILIPIAINMYYAKRKKKLLFACLQKTKTNFLDQCNTIWNKLARFLKRMTTTEEDIFTIAARIEKHDSKPKTKNPARLRVNPVIKEQLRVETDMARALYANAAGAHHSETSGSVIRPLGTWEKVNQKDTPRTPKKTKNTKEKDLSESAKSGENSSNVLPKHPQETATHETASANKVCSLPLGVFCCCLCCCTCGSRRYSLVLESEEILVVEGSEDKEDDEVAEAPTETGGVKSSMGRGKGNANVNPHNKSQAKDMRAFLKNRWWAEYSFWFKPFGVLMVALFFSSIFLSLRAGSKIEYLSPEDDVTAFKNALVPSSANYSYVILCHQDPYAKLSKSWEMLVLGRDKVSEKVKGAVLDCMAPLPDNFFYNHGMVLDYAPDLAPLKGKTVKEAFHLNFEVKDKKKKHTVAFVTSFKRRPLQIPPAMLASEDDLEEAYEFIEMATNCNPKLWALKNEKHLKKYCTNPWFPACGLVLRNNALEEDVKEILSYLVRKFPYMNFAQVDMKKHELSIEHKLPEQESNDPNVPHFLVLHTRESDSAVAARAFRGFFTKDNVEQFTQTTLDGILSAEPTKFLSSPLTIYKRGGAESKRASKKKAKQKAKAEKKEKRKKKMAKRSATPPKRKVEKPKRKQKRSAERKEAEVQDPEPQENTHGAPHNEEDVLDLDSEELEHDWAQEWQKFATE